MSDELKTVENFIYNSDVHKTLSEINSRVMDYNILEIVGMGTQEIKHSNILGWMFGDNEHSQGYKILLDFLALVIEENDNSDLIKEIKTLKEYIFLSKKEKNLQIFREKDNIDLLIVDDMNKVVIAIENKVYANERVNGEDGGQLCKYENIIDTKYSAEYKKYFVYLTIDLEEPSNGNWLKADYEMIVKSIKSILDSKSVTEKTNIVLSSYIDLLKRRGIVEEKNIKELCEKIWMNKEHREALNIIINYKPSNYERISDLIVKKLKAIGVIKWELYAKNYNNIFFKTDCISDKLYDNNEIFYNFIFNNNGVSLKIYIEKEEEKFDNLYKDLFPSNTKRYHGSQLESVKNENWHDYINNIGLKNLEEDIDKDLTTIFDKIKWCDKILTKHFN